MADEALMPEGPLCEFVREHAGRALEGLTPLVQSDVDELEAALTVRSVHDTRTSLRRLRAVLRAVAGDGAGATATDHDLRTVARALGEVRDSDVLRENLLDEQEPLTPEQLRSPQHLPPQLPDPQPGAEPSAATDRARTELSAALHRRRRLGAEQVGRARLGPEWARVLAQLEHWHRDPPPVLIERPAELLEGLRGRTRSRLRAAGGDTTALHAARRAAKRWRYVAEMLLPVLPEASTHVEEANRIHTRLGELQDAVVAVEFLREHRGELRRRGRDDALAAALLEREERRMLQIVAEAPQLL